METEKEVRTPWIPLDVTIEILSRLPGKSVVRFRCVSKLWSSITTSPRFIKSFTVHSLARPSLLVVQKKEDKRVFFSLPHHQDPRRRYTRVEKYEMMLPKQDPKWVDGKVFSSVRGLICFEDDHDQVVIWNPTLRQHVFLPDPKLSRPLITFLVYDPIDDQYKVLCMSGNRNIRRQNPRVLTLGDRESWRTTEPCSLGLPWRADEGGFTSGICLDGILYYYKSYCYILESFDVRSEKFKQIEMPHEDVYDPTLGWAFIATYQGMLALLFCTGRRWVLTDPERHEWSKGSFSLPHPCTLPGVDGPCDNYLQVGGVTDYEEFVYYMQEPRTRPPFYAFFHDLKKNTTRWVAYEGLTDCDSNCVDRFPDHVENLMSLAHLSFL